jgi:hypothetical protein
MTVFEQAKQYYHHLEYQKAIDTINELLKNKTIEIKSIDYPDILCYLGDSKLGLYEKTKNKSLLYEALTDFATGANALLVFHNTTSNDLNNRLKKCIELL